MADYDDPGWVPIVAHLWPAVVFPLVGLSKRYQQRRKTATAQPLTAGRLIFVGIFMAPFLILFVLSFIVTGPGRWSSPGGWGWGAAALGAAGLMAVSTIRRRPLDGSDPKALLKSWVGRMFLGIGAAELSLLGAFVLTLISYRLWVFVVGLTFTVVGFVLVAPSRRNIEQRQSQLDAEGSPLSLGRVLTTPQRPDTT